jgi:DNA-binding response OmpR family regulator
MKTKTKRSISYSKQFEFNIGSFYLNSKIRSLHFGDKIPTRLSPKENALLRLLALYKNNLMPRELALNKIWHTDDYFAGRSMDVYIAKLRKYLKPDDNVKILNVHNKGFKLIVDN